MQFLLCPAFHRPSTAFSFDPLNVLFCPSCFPHHEGVYLSVGTSPHFQLPTRVAGPCFDSFFLFFFFLSSYPVVRGFSCPFRCPKSSANVQQVVYENCSICRCILDVLVRSNEFHVLLFCHLDFSSILTLKEDL